MGLSKRVIQDTRAHSDQFSTESVQDLVCQNGNLELNSLRERTGRGDRQIDASVM